MPASLLRAWSLRRCSKLWWGGALCRATSQGAGEQVQATAHPGGTAQPQPLLASPGDPIEARSPYFPCSLALVTGRSGPAGDSDGDPWDVPEVPQWPRSSRRVSGSDCWATR